MIRAFWFFLFITILCVGAAYISERPGQATLTWLGYKLETSVGVLLTIIAIFSLLLAITLRLLVLIKQAPRNLMVARREWRQRRGYKALTQGMVAVAAGDAIEAKRLSRKAENLLADPPLTMLLSAQAAQLSGDEKAATKFFEAMTERKETKYLGLSGQLKQAIQDGDTSGALELAEQASNLKPRTSKVTATLFDLQIKNHEWKNAEETAKKLVKEGTIERQEGSRYRAILLYQQSIEDQNEGRLKESLENSRKSNSLAPDFVPAAVQTARLLQGAGQRRKAASIVEESWVSCPHPHLVEVMKDLTPSTGPLEIMRTLEGLAKYNKEHVESHVAIASSALSAGMLGVAREHLEAISDDNPSARVCRYMAELTEAEGQGSGSTSKWLKRASLADPDSAWVCDSCGNILAKWQPVCERCEKFDSLAWQAPPRVSEMMVDEQD